MYHLFAFIQTSRIISVEYRKALHKALALNLTKPCFRRGNAIKFNTQANEVLINPHQALLNKSIYLYTLKNLLFSNIFVLIFFIY